MSVPGPHEIFEQMRRHWLGESDAELLADDAVIEMPFAPPGRPNRFESRAEFRDRTADERAAFPVRFEEVRDVVIHDTTDPEVIVVEYTLAGVNEATGHRASAPFIGVLRVRDGRTVLWREYQNTLAIAAALGQVPDLLAAFSGK
ncbi:nuclear transport factor 2 family protein [Actinomadura sp. DC4]|uniref:nuclear transport factor 2 family protein n=1 Tax=Actinomadura sp. DC4 TaxID=3055069 RepID=UPI0025B218D2|nr:nuclear transport factor 2 family protein [Actinomadura sp. DC4]MDN3354498.1 nuclear transport factor 2 family protein [Actinomadura sp. DC4]